MIFTKIFTKPKRKKEKETSDTANSYGTEKANDEKKIS